jgi:hypothetical protein
MRRRTLSMSFAALALCLGLGLIAAGCGASGPPTAVDPGTSEQPLAESTVSNLTECAKTWAGDLKKRSYKLRFNVTINKRGGVSGVEPEGSGLDVGDMEECMIGALTNMTVPAFVYERVEEELASQPVSPQSRGHMGNVMVLGGAVSLVPILIVAAGVTIIIGVTIHVLSDTSTSTRDATDEDREKWRCKKVKQECIDYCSDTVIPTRDHGVSFQNCKHHCLERHDCPRDS